MEHQSPIQQVKTHQTSDAMPAYKSNLGTIQLRDTHTKEIILIPAPSNDPNDPLNWSTPKRAYVTFLAILAIFIGTFFSAGPSVAILDMTKTFFGKPGPHLLQHISRIAFFITTASLMQGMANLFWMPFILKYGRRPVYIFAFLMYTGTTVWLAVAKSYSSELAARIFFGFASGVGETLAPLTIADIYFVHQRGAIMALYTAGLSGGVAGGIIISGLITISHGWRTIYHVAIGLVGGTTILVFFTMPETAFARDPVILPPGSETRERSSLAKENDAESCFEESAPADVKIAPKKTFLQNMALYSGTYTNEGLLKLFIRPIGLLIVPQVLWATLVMSVLIGFLVAIASNFATAFAATYKFKPYQSGLCFIAGLIGSLTGIAFGGIFTDKIADFFTRRNGGLREPEMRLPAIFPTLICGPLSLVLYGVGIENKLHWMVPTFALGLLNFSIVQGVNVSFVYTIDSYRPIGGEIIVTQLAFKAAFSFLLSFYTNPWIQKLGYAKAFGTMAAISFSVLIMAIPFYFFGKRIRHMSVKWKVVRMLYWDADREVGE